MVDRPMPKRAQLARAARFAAIQAGSHKGDTAFAARCWRAPGDFAKLATMQAAPLPLARMPRSPSARRSGAAPGHVTIALLCAAIPLHAAAETFRFDPVHSQVWFSAGHQGFSNPQGRLRIKQGWFRFDPKDWASAQVDVVFDLASADLGDPKWNKAVQAAALLDVGQYPTARFASRSVERIDDRRGVIHGELDLRGRRLPVDVAFTLNRIGNDPYAFGRKAGFSASASLSRSDFGMTRYEDVVGQTITLRFEIEGIADRDAADSRTGGVHDGDQE
jgi:polyisoprenoid-binding protein YceI